MVESAAQDLERLVAYNQKSFLEFNQRKLDQIASLLPERKERAMWLVPVLLHLNFELKKGPLARVSDSTPAGIRDLKAPPDLNVLLAHALPEAEVPPRTPWGVRARKMPIRSLLLMGSLGSIGQSAKSDFDFWVVISREEIGDQGEADLAAKCKAISSWLQESAGAEATFFLVDMDEVRDNNFGELKGESAGSALATLLKEEFYRSLTLLGGQTPWWWVLPPGLDGKGYREAIQSLKGSQMVDLGAFVDLGHVGKLDPNEFFGASLWEINKSLDSPFKSALKMGLIEAYAEEGGGEVLAERLKRRVVEEGDPLPDSYLLMFERVAEHLIAGGREGDLEVVRSCLYLKSNPRLVASDLGPKAQLSGRKAMFAKQVKAWGWSGKHVEGLSGYQSWPLTRRLGLADQINRFMLGAYTRLVKKFKSTEGLKATIDPLDLTTVGRRLILFYSQKPDRVAFVPNLLENPRPLGRVTFRLLGRVKGGQATVWEGYEGASDRPGPELKLIRTSGLPHLLAWLAVNGLAHSGTGFHLTPPPSNLQNPFTVPEIQSLFNLILKLFGGLRQVIPSRNELIKAARVNHICVIPNLEEQGWVEELKSLNILYSTSWGELYVKELAGPDGMEATRKLLVPEPGHLPPELTIYVLPRPSAQTLVSQIKKGLLGYYHHLGPESA